MYENDVQVKGSGRCSEDLSYCGNRLVFNCHLNNRSVYRSDAGRSFCVHGCVRK